MKAPSRGRGKRWSEQDDLKLVDALRAGSSLTEIATELGRSRVAALSRLKLLSASDDGLKALYALHVRAGR